MKHVVYLFKLYLLMKRTKIVATIGPASEKPEILTKMVESGLNVARLNFSHNKHAHHLMLINNLRAVAKKTRRAVSLLQDLQGPRIRIGDVGTGVMVEDGQAVSMTYSTKAYQAGKSVVIPMHYERLHQDLKSGSLILIDDGMIILEVKKIAGKMIDTIVKRGGLIRTHKGMNFPNATITADPLTAKDLADVEFGVKNKVDFVALSFVKDAADIERLRSHIIRLERKYHKLVKSAKQPMTKIIAKIERIEAVDNIDEIIEASDGIMVARGDLGIELPFEQVPLIQKDIVYRCSLIGKPVIVATQMLESMMKSPLPTRAEVSDVANAILDGTDAIMLSGESAGGLYPIESVQAMQRIAKNIEKVEFKIQQELDSQLKQVKYLVDFIAYSAQDLAERMGVKAMICFTQSGYTARMISRYKSKVPLFVFTEDANVRNQINLSWGAIPYQIKFNSSYKKILADASKVLKQDGLVKKGDQVLVCAGQSLHLFSEDNFIKIDKIV